MWFGTSVSPFKSCWRLPAFAICTPDASCSSSRRGQEAEHSYDADLAELTNLSPWWSAKQVWGAFGCYYLYATSTEQYMTGIQPVGKVR